MEKSLWDKAGDVGGLDGFIRSGPQMGAPEKKKRKQSAQGSSISPLSEYAPPTITSSDHLIACNPFDDEYSIPYVSGYTYFGKLGHSNAETFNTFRMPPNTSPKRPSRNVGFQTFRDQAIYLTKDLKTMGRNIPINLALQEKTVFDSIYSNMGQTISMPGQHFRPNQSEEDFHLMSIQTSSPRNDFQIGSYRSQGVKMHISQMDSSHLFSSAQTHFMPSKMLNLNQDFKSASNSNLNSVGPQERSDLDAPSQPNSSPQSQSKHLGDPEHFQIETVNLSDIGLTNGTRIKPSLSRLVKTDVTPSEKCNRWLLHSNFYGPLSTENVYPCGICSVDVNNMEDAILCEVSCHKWFHRTCTGMTEMAYALLRAEALAIWGCDTCMAKKDVQLVRIKK
ncbi:pygopus homolog 1 [Hyperolius riggenbachi]|uniref:pygopus homolog 1 n=1 Tax=Hyperolius riggenbachi TaxID=752182 RepID=UPI0035A2A23E